MSFILDAHGIRNYFNNDLGRHQWLEHANSPKATYETHSSAKTAI